MHVPMQPLPVFLVLQKGVSVFCGKHDVNKEIAERLGHGFVSPFQGFCLGLPVNQGAYPGV